MMVEPKIIICSKERNKATKGFRFQVKGIFGLLSMYCSALRNTTYCGKALRINVYVDVNMSAQFRQMSALLRRLGLSPVCDFGCTDLYRLVAR